VDDRPEGRPSPQAKGVWFVSARRCLLAEHGEAALSRVVERMGGEHGPALLEPFASAWYPEKSFQLALAAVSEEVFHGDPEGLCTFIEASTIIGINRFLRAVLALTSPAFVLSKMPAFWGRYRQNNGTLVVELGERAARLQYEGFPFFGDRNYRIFIRGVLRKTLEMSSGERPEVTVRDYAEDRLTVDLFFKERRLRA